MSVIKIGKHEIEPKYTFNSFKYMEEFNAKDFEELESKPFKIIGVLRMLLMGAVNHNPKVKIREDEVDVFLESFMADGDVPALMGELMELLQESSFFKSLQKSE